MSQIDLSLLSSYHFDLPEAQIAVNPTQRREDARLLHLPIDGGLVHTNVSRLPEILREGDLVIFNDVRVRPCRLMGHKTSGGEVEVLVVKATRADNNTWRAEGMVRSHKPLKPMQPLTFGASPSAHISGHYVGRSEAEGLALVEFEWSGTWEALLDAVGEMPLPPYIVKRRKALGLKRHDVEDLARYQTVFAGKDGEAAAAPTAGLHFSQALMEQLAVSGVQTATLRLDVGLGTFKPVRVEHLEGHVMHSERYVIGEALVEAFEHTKRAGRRVIAVGTTVLRALEDQMQRFDGFLRAGTFDTSIFLKPGHVFRSVDGLMTNFHLPDSTLIVLVAAFGGYGRVMDAYKEAVAHNYRFFSYGDAMLLWRSQTIS
jgi:S-adenosylmethionine:tRNA ribosyltransferase-isomerase